MNVLPPKYLTSWWRTTCQVAGGIQDSRKGRLGGQVPLTSVTSARDLDTNESREFPSNRVGPSKQVLLLPPAVAGSVFRLFSGEMKLAAERRPGRGTVTSASARRVLWAGWIVWPGPRKHPASGTLVQCSNCSPTAWERAGLPPFFRTPPLL